MIEIRNLIFFNFYIGIYLVIDSGYCLNKWGLGLCKEIIIDGNILCIIV